VIIIDQYVYPIPEEITLNVTVLLSLVVAWMMFKSAGDPIASAKKETVQITSNTLHKLKKAIEEEKMYRKPSITLKEFSGIIEEPSYLVSKAVKKQYGLSFPELINKYRIKDIIEKLATQEGEELKIESIAYEYGFNTPSAFYSAFKKETSLTPKEFRSKKNSAIG
jgi:AraC-like DNA-binding protein